MWVYIFLCETKALYTMPLLEARHTDRFHDVCAPWVSHGQRVLRDFMNHTNESGPLSFERNNPDSIGKRAL